ncbi:DsbA family protein [Chamaesiphon minutus]|uniref:Protein-disulfide isomerase n=1 Tax=Chamaesiphon minutus (strain ATCC 27169 / PCC 6605) TaxID=1173020 RepID=K9UFP5_CHAP6|nr:thioredoxin domain-containing protein [Chamaesiphon minutus]AFY93927.1 protein-disulfide isomerase [Chamaesiphon minutus PCC 6605]
MNYLLNLWRLPILSLVLSSLILGAMPAQADSQSKRIAPIVTAEKSIAAEQLIQPGVERNFSATDRIVTSETRLAQSVKVTPQLEKQILEVIRRNPDVLLEVLQKYALEQQQKEQKAQAEALKQARRNTKALIGNSPTTGASQRQIVMVAFSDFQCPFCATADRNVKQFMTKHKDKVTLVYKYFPLTQIHPEALPAARAAWAANKQGKFWEYHDALYANQAKLGESFYVETANALKLDLKKFNADRKIADDAIVEDFKLGRKLGVDGTPTFILNGEVVTGAASLADLEKALAQVTKK